MPDNSVVIPIPGEGEDEMAEVSPQFERLHDQNMGAMGQALSRFQNDVVTVSKAADYSYLQDKDLVSLAEAVGVREVAARVTPAGPVPATPIG